MKLYIIRGAPNARKAEAVVHHLSIALEMQELDIRSGEHKTGAYLAINPNGLVPTLVDGDFTLWESHAIMTYLADLTGADALYPKGLKERADVDRWLAWGQAHFGRAAGAIAWEGFMKRRLGRGETDPGVLAEGVDAFHGDAPILEARLAATGAFVCGPDVTLADFSLAATQGFWFKAGVPLEPYPAIRSWVSRLEALPAWQASAPPAFLLKQSGVAA